MSDDAIKDALRMMPYGFYAITSKHGDEVNAMVANWVMQASFEPRQVAVGLAKSAFSYNLIKEGGVFGVNIFLKDDQDSLMPFTKGRAKNPDKMTDANYEAAPETGVPVLAGAAAVIECRVVGELDSGGDHVIIVGEAVAANVMKEGEPNDVLSLPHLGWSYAG